MWQQPEELCENHLHHKKAVHQKVRHNNPENPLEGQWPVQVA
jgi:hypothetical protein